MTFRSFFIDLYSKHYQHLSIRQRIERSIVMSKLTRKLTPSTGLTSSNLLRQSLKTDAVLLKNYSSCLFAHVYRLSIGSLSHLPSLYNQAVFHSILTQLHHNMSIDLDIKQENVIGGGNYLRAMLDDVNNYGGDESFFVVSIYSATSSSLKSWNRPAKNGKANTPIYDLFHLASQHPPSSIRCFSSVKIKCPLAYLILCFCYENFAFSDNSYSP